MHSLTIPFNPETIKEAIIALSALTLPLRAVVNTELEELTILCDVRHAAVVERTLAPYV